VSQSAAVRFKNKRPSSKVSHCSGSPARLGRIGDRSARGQGQGEQRIFFPCCILLHCVASPPRVRSPWLPTSFSVVSDCVHCGDASNQYLFSGATKCDILRHPEARRPGGATPPTHLILRCASKRKRIRRKSAFGCNRLAVRQRSDGTVVSQLVATRFAEGRPFVERNGRLSKLRHYGLGTIPGLMVRASDEFCNIGCRCRLGFAACKPTARSRSLTRNAPSPGRPVSRDDGRIPPAGSADGLPLHRSR